MLFGLFLIFAMLKLCSVITTSWWIVCIPLFIWAFIAVVILLAAGLFNIDWS